MNQLEFNKKLFNNVYLIYAYDFLGFFMIIMPVLVPFFKDCGLSMEQIYQLQAIFSVGLIVCEIPSGYLSDVWGRKGTLIAAWVCECIGALLILVAKDFNTLLAFELMLAVSLSLRSGTDLSFIYDSLYAAGKEGSQSKVMATFFKVTNSAEGFAALLASGILIFGGSINVILGIYIITRFLSGIPLWFLVEPPRKLMDRGEHKANFVKICKFLRRGDEIIFAIFLNLVFWSLSTFIVIWTYQHIWSEVGISIAYFGLMWAAMSLANSIVAGFIPNWQSKLGNNNLLFVMGISPILGYLGFAFIKAWPVVLLGILFSITRAINGVVLKDAFNLRLPSEFRATANSMVNFAFRIVFVFVGPLAGYLLDHRGTSAMMLTFALFFLITYFVLLVPLLLRIKSREAIV